MADDEMAVDTSLRRGGVVTSEQTNTKREPMYRVIGTSKVPVSKQYGKLWASRKDQALAKRRARRIEPAWDEAIKYYQNDQLPHRSEGDQDHVGNRIVARHRAGSMNSETENVIFSNINSVTPAIYSKNPRAEFTVEDETMKGLAACTERLVNRLANMRSAPGFNLKPKATRCVVMSQLTNSSWIEVGYTKKDQSVENAVEDIQALAEQLSKAKNKQEIELIEGKLQSIEEKIDVLQPAGPWVKYRRPHQVLVDPDAVEDDLSDANWVMIYDYMSTSYIKAMFAKPKNTDGKTEYESIYKPTHVMRIGANEDSTGIDDEVNTFSLLGDSETYSSYGYSDKDTFDRACRTKVWWVWDKTTRRVFLYNDKDWTWPLWVWDDPYKLDTFFNVERLWFHTNPEGGETKGEVTYYLDQQDAINEVNDEERRSRLWIRERVFYNKNVLDAQQVKDIMEGPSRNYAGVDIPPDSKLQDHVFSLAPPSVDYPSVFNTAIQRKLEAIARISGTTDVMRGVQFKTNTTNKAIENYEATTATRLDQKVDAVEDFVGNVFWKVAQLCLQNMNFDEVSSVIGATHAANWRQMSAAEIKQSFSPRVVGGSTSKPTTRAKKQEALELGQVLGQFARAAPGPILQVMMRVFEQAFDEVVITDKDWQALQQAMFGAPAGAGPAQPGQPQPQQPGQPPQQGQEPIQNPQQLDAVLTQMQMVFDQLPPEAKQALIAMISRGVPLKQAVAELMAAMQGQGQQQPTPQQPQAA